MAHVSTEVSVHTQTQNDQCPLNGVHMKLLYDVPKFILYGFSHTMLLSVSAVILQYSGYPETTNATENNKRY